MVNRIVCGLENRQWPSRSFVGSNPTPAAHASDSAWLSRFGGFQNRLDARCLFRMRTGLGNRVPLAPERHDSSTARRVGGRFRPMVEPFPGCYEGGQKVPPDRPGPPPTAISKHGGRNGGANSRPLSAAAMGPTLPRKPSDQASTNPGRFTTHQAHTLRSPPQDPGTRAATGPTHGSRHHSFD